MRDGGGSHREGREGQDRPREQPLLYRAFGPRHEHIGDREEEPGDRQRLQQPFVEADIAGAPLLPRLRRLFRRAAALEDEQYQHEARRAAQQQYRAEYRPRGSRHRGGHHHRRGPAVQVGGEGEQQRPPLGGTLRNIPAVERRGDKGRARLRGAEGERQRHSERRADARLPQMRHKPPHEPVGESAS
ncbi:hypothetical protein SDC9_149539 [bioreactor metagenome]|uniref:Uncharacterized protein n=1 Tax=bioreactor metagenome TaxID=1076179 RepID=A0A645EP53_9ZZZZ